MLSNEMKEQVCSRYSCEAAGMERFSLDLTQAIQNVVRSGN